MKLQDLPKYDLFWL